GLIRMVDADKYCIDILQQIQAVQGALAQTSKQLLQSHMKTCVVHAFDSNQAAERDRVIAEVVDLFAKSSRTGTGK
ncbi:MAG: DNA-binding FrmR family transcriptional regulator, partial [Planctomycetota bacterium]